MSLPRYAEYKDSGLDWIGMVPTHWSGPVTLGSISSLKGRLGWQGLKADEYCDEGPYVVSSAHFSDFKIRWDECPRISDERYEADSNIQLSEQDILLMKDGAAMGKLAFIADLPGKACLNSHLLLFRPLYPDGETPTYLPKFSFYYMQTGLFQEHIKVNGTGATFLGISQEAISKYRVVWPDLAEQTAIATFLDCETNKIDALIAEQETLLTLLAEKRQATISHAVTRGLNPAAPLKDSGVTWLGEVPEHWDLTRVKRVVSSIEQGWSPQCENYPVENGNEWGVLKVGCVNGGMFNSSENKKLPQELEPIPAYSLKRGDLLISRANTRELVGSAAVVPADFDNLLLCDKLYRLRMIESDCLAEFVAAYLGTREARAQIELEATGASSSMLNIGQSVILDLLMPLPDLDEQKRIFEFIRAETTKLDTLKDEAERAIALLKERRSALISAAVTGQIDVRNA